MAQVANLSGINNTDRQLNFKTNIQNNVGLISPNTWVRLIGGAFALVLLKLMGVTWMPLLVLVIIIINLMSCNSLTSRLFPKAFPCSNPINALDNIVTIWIYCLFLLLFGDLFDPITRFVLLFFVVLRAIFVAIYYYTGSPNDWFQYFDIIEPILISYGIRNIFHTSYETYWSLIILMVFLKIMLLWSLQKRPNFN